MKSTSSGTWQVRRKSTHNKHYIGTIRPQDYSTITDGLHAVRHTVEYFQNRGGRIDIPHHHRYWEYGSAVDAFLSMYKERASEKRLLDVGSGMGAAGPTLALSFGTHVYECEPDMLSVMSRKLVNDLLVKAYRPAIVVTPQSFGNLPEEQFDAVFCLSVIEHLAIAVENACWQQLADRVKPHGLLFLTCDCVEDSRKHYTFDEFRVQKLTTAMLRERVEAVCKMGFTPMGEPDYVYHGPEVFDYTFFRMGFVKQ